MLNIARDSFNLKDFEARLQQHLEEIDGVFIPITVNCVLKKNLLRIVVQTDDSTSLSPQKIFPEIKKIMEQESIPQSLEIQMGLMVHEGEFFSPFLDSDLRKENRLLLPPVATHFKQEIFSQLKFHLSRPASKRITKSALLIISLSAGIYIISRPCSFGSCPTLPQAQQLAQEAIAIFETAPSNQNLADAQHRLTQAIKQLNQIPWWSSYHAQTTALLTLYQARLDNLEQINRALEKASQAVLKAQNPPLPVSQWQEVQQLWQEAIADLKELPSQSPFFSFAQAKTRDYQSNLAAITQRLQAEKQAQISLAKAQEAGQIAKTRQDAAKSAQDWQLVYATWQTAIKRLKEIAPGTTLSQQKEQLLTRYIPVFTEASVRLQQEKSAQNYYNQGIEQAKLAEQSQKSQQWSSAVSSWRKAITALKQIQPNTFTASQAQSLMSNYTIALKQAEVNLKNAIKLQEINQSLAEVCHKNQKICQYQMTENAIKVNLTPIYMQQVWQTALEAKAQGNLHTQIELLNHISRLEQTWQTISNKAKKDVEIHNPEGELIAKYEPR